MRIFSTILFTAVCASGLAQESVPATGGQGTGTGGTMSFSVGQVVYATTSSTAGTLNEGVQQTYTVVELGSTDALDLIVEVSVFPNPSSDFVNIKIADIGSGTYRYELTDISGKQIISDVISASMTEVNIQEQSSGSYFLTIYDEHSRSKKYKVIKQ